MPASYWSIYAHVFQEHAIAGRKHPDRTTRQYFTEVCRLMKQATVVYIPTEQADAIPRLGPTFEEEAAGTAYLRAPFDLTFLAIGGEVAADLSVGWADTSLYGALLFQEESRLRVMPFFRWPSGSRTKTLARGEAFATSEGFGTLYGPETLTRQGSGAYDGSLRKEVGELICGGTARALRALFLLESVNVRLVEGKPAGPGHRGNGVPSFEVVIREPTRSEHDPSAQTVDWSHRWEVRGHFKHFRKGPVYKANPDRRIEVDGDSYVRVWCPPYIKGPPDKPLVPKVHVYAGGPR
jgi:hypothetical protein